MTWNFFSDFQDVLDILLVGLLIFWFLLIIRRTRTLHILIGLGLLGLFYALSVWLEFGILNWILGKFFSYLPVILVILFHVEIRRALAYLGRLVCLNKCRVKEVQFIDEISKAVQTLSQNAHGALIVIERQVNLKDFIEIGVHLYAKVTSELIVSLFHPSSPLHDGALIVRGEKLYAARCFLPLVKDDTIDKSLGTRHRAAIHLAKETDAVVLVLSEESKNISMVYRDHLNLDIDHQSLKTKLYELLYVSQANQKGK